MNMLVQVHSVEHSDETIINDVRVVTMTVEITHTMTAWLDDVINASIRSESS